MGKQRINGELGRKNAINGGIRENLRLPLSFLEHKQIRAQKKRRFQAIFQPEGHSLSTRVPRSTCFDLKFIYFTSISGRLKWKARRRRERHVPPSQRPSEHWLHWWWTPPRRLYGRRSSALGRFSKRRNYPPFLDYFSIIRILVLLFVISGWYLLIFLLLFPFNSPISQSWHVSLRVLAKMLPKLNYL